MGNKYRISELLALCIAMIGTVLIGFEASNWKEILTFSNIWIILPYISFFIISTVANKISKSPNVSQASCITAILILIFTLLVYIDAFYISISSTSALVFLFVPFYLLFGGPILFIIIFKIISRIHKYQNQTLNKRLHEERS